MIRAHEASEVTPASRPRPVYMLKQSVYLPWHKLHWQGSTSARCGPGPLTDGAPSLGHHHFDELLIVDLPVTINVRFPNHPVDLLVRELLPEVRHDVAQLRRADEAIAVAVEDLESFDELLLCVSVLHLARHQGQELWEINR